MADDNLNLAQIRALALEAGFDRFSEEHLEQLMRATNASRARRKKLRTQKLTYADEPAHVFRIAEQGTP